MAWWQKAVSQLVGQPGNVAVLSPESYYPSQDYKRTDLIVEEAH